ncbi:MAG: hypothetical protein GF401_00130 [Chitinivibrionales bacterium]|nr:hypothetical protein [Chitinivibrionales bacterium]
MLVGTCYITVAQKLIIGPFDFNVFRILLGVGWIRILIRKEMVLSHITRVDKYLLLFTISNFMLYALQRNSLDTTINRLGFVYTTLGLYFLFRFLIRDIDEIHHALRTAALVIIPLAVSMLLENTTGRNRFSVFGGVPEISFVRYGEIRAQGPFRHPILAGTTGATLFPLLASLWFFTAKDRFLGLIGISASLIIIITTSSSGPLVALIASVAGMFCWFFRYRMKAVRRSIIAGLVLLQIAMNAPIYYIYAKLGSIIGGTGWHRSYLIHQSIVHLNEWWLMGVEFTGDWMPYTLDNGQADMTNQYLHYGVYSGLLTMVLFIVLIIKAYILIGTMIALAEEKGLDFPLQITIWFLGASLFSHTISFLSVSYFDQTIVFWYFLLAVISSLYSRLLTLDYPPETVQEVSR